MSVQIYKVIKQTAGGFHSWVESNVGVIRKPNNKIFINIKPDLFKNTDFAISPNLTAIISKKSWFLRTWECIKRKLKNSWNILPKS
jgi:hypothetical protein